ncbi:MAG TPA: glycerophosphodiester phosphodiesterase family protein [Candidatus Saccharimonadales bacterium]|nr:glycerophosphodiester phosphodiesterase family protein [Candidatus Saccharimonadales bacterium]
MNKRRAEDYPFYDISGPIAIAKKANTLAAIQSAQDVGITYVELDVVDTLDGEGLIYHDAKNKRDAKRLGLELTRIIQNKTLDDTRSYLRAGDEELTTIEEVLKTFLGTRVFIDIKTAGAAIAVAKAVLDQRAQERVSLGSYNYRYTKIAASLLGGQERTATSPGTFESYLLRTSSQIFKRFVQKSPITSIHLADYQTPCWMVELTEEMGVNLNTWAGPDEEQDNREYIERNLDAGVGGIMSIRTKDLVEAFDSGGHPFSLRKPLGNLAINSLTTPDIRAII